MPFMNFLVHSYTCCSDRHASPYLTLIRRWISMGFTISLFKKRMTEHCSSLVHVASGAAIFILLLRHCVAFLHRTATCQQCLKPWVSLLSTYKTIELFRIFTALLKFSFDSPYVCVCVCVIVKVWSPLFHELPRYFYSNKNGTLKFIMGDYSRLPVFCPQTDPR